MLFSHKDRKLIELLNRQAEEIIRGQVNGTALLEQYPDLAGEAEPLMALANALAQALEPVRPSDHYRAHLRQGLIDAAQRKRARQMAMSQSHRWVPWRPWLLGAAAVGSAVSVLGVIAYLVRNRYSDRTEQTASR